MDFPSPVAAILHLLFNQMHPVISLCGSLYERRNQVTKLKMPLMNCRKIFYTYLAGKLCITVSFVSAANNVPSVTVNGNGSLTHQWTVLEANSVIFSTSDPDNDTVTMFGFGLPSGSTLSQVQDSNLWEFVWTPMNMNPVVLV